MDPTQLPASQKVPCIGVRSTSNYRNLANDERHAAYDMVLQQSCNGKPKHGSMSSTAQHFGVSTETISRIWKRGRTSLADGAIVADFSSRMSGQCGKKMKQDIENVERAVKAAPFEKRQTLRSLEACTGILRSTLSVYLKLPNMLKRVSSSLRPLLKDANKDKRVAFARSFMTNDPDSGMSFVDMYDYIHVDKKWFYLRRTKTKIGVSRVRNKTKFGVDSAVLNSGIEYKVALHQNSTPSSRHTFILAYVAEDGYVRHFPQPLGVCVWAAANIIRLDDHFNFVSNSS